MSAVSFVDGPGVGANRRFESVPAGHNILVVGVKHGQRLGEYHRCEVIAGFLDVQNEKGEAQNTFTTGGLVRIAAIDVESDWEVVRTDPRCREDGA
jgi:hypothetical protein